MRRILRNRLQLVAYLFVVAMGAFGLWLVEHRADQAADALEIEEDTREREGCERANEGREQIRDVAVEVGVESAEAVIEVATAGEDPPDPAVIEAYRAAVQRRMEAIAAQLEDRDCEEELDR